MRISFIREVVPMIALTVSLMVTLTIGMDVIRAVQQAPELQQQTISEEEDNSDHSMAIGYSVARGDGAIAIGSYAHADDEVAIHLRASDKAQIKVLDDGTVLAHRYETFDEYESHLDESVGWGNESSVNTFDEGDLFEIDLG